MVQVLKRTAGRLIGILIPIIVFSVIAPQTASAQFSITITLDENGNGVLTNTTPLVSALPFTRQADPGPGGLANALTYGLLSPPGLTAGDLVLQEFAGGAASDVIRFNPTESCSNTVGCLVFYSDNGDGSDSLADIGLPASFYTNVVSFLEVGPEGNNGFTYTPTAGQPGFVAGAGGPVTYVIKSDTPVPEPASLVLLASGLIGIVVIRSRRHQRS